MNPWIEKGCRTLPGSRQVEEHFRLHFSLQGFRCGVSGCNFIGSTIPGAFDELRRTPLHAAVAANRLGAGLANDPFRMLLYRKIQETNAASCYERQLQLDIECENK